MSFQRIAIEFMFDLVFEAAPGVRMLGDSSGCEVI